MAIRFEPDDLITAQWPPTGMITYGVPLTGAYAGQFCQLNSSGVIIPVGSNTSKAGTVTVSSAGTHTLTFGTAYGLAVQIADCG